MVDVETAIIVVVVILLAISFGLCCHCLSTKRRQDESERQRSVTTQQTAITDDSERNRSTVYTLHLQEWNSNNSNVNPAGNNAIQNPQEENENLLNDPIAESGPPPYSGLIATDLVEPTLPPPSYDEALQIETDGISASNASATPDQSGNERAEHFV
ncbi:hypothetical protein P5673_010587 [Acropora cervicornis]|uniref:Uncharacterized protein n=1 Tax=Acropora cervicornis TaxID=6130 RepID=A0AAD9V8U9_ACRCE|nr:hypothetical protein P5673_010587 [Acropora cervicornis]